MIDTSGKPSRPLARSSFSRAQRPSSVHIRTTEANSEDDGGPGDSFYKNSFHTHAARGKVKVKNKSKKDTTFVHFGNDSWNLVLHMLFGIRQSVHSVRYDDVF